MSNRLCAQSTTVVLTGIAARRLIRALTGRPCESEHRPGRSSGRHTSALNLPDETRRNDPCPCGSGKKYKQCCLLAAAAAHSSPAELAWRRIRRANEGLVGRMMQFTFEAYGEAALDEAWAEFMLWDEEQALENWEASPHQSAFLPWMLHHWSPAPDETGVADEDLHGIEPTRAYLERKGRHLDETTRRYLEACLAAPFDFHEVTHCDPATGPKSL